MKADIREKVRKLLNQAADREGTPEGDTFREKAFALIARYGLDPAKLGDPRDDGARVVVVEIELYGSYLRQQVGLLAVLCHALHCEVVYTAGRGSGEATVIGAARHVERVQLLYTVLRPHMLAGAADLRSGHSSLTARLRRSFMVGFAVAIGERLATEEEKAAERQAGAGLVLVGDRDRAREELNRRFPRLRTSSSKARIDGDAFLHGAAAGHSTDLGQDRMGGRRAIGA